MDWPRRLCRTRTRPSSEALQVYVSNSRGWALPPGDPKQDTLFRDGCGERGLPAYIHASLLVNLGSPTELTVERSAQTLEHALHRGAAIGATAVVFHAGSSVDEDPGGKALHRLREALLPLLDTAAQRGLPRLLVEPSAGGGRSLASKVQDLGPYLDAVEHHPWLGVCFDTCHAWAAGHDLARPGGMTETLDALVAAVGPGLAPAGTRQRLQGRVRLDPRPPRDHRRGPDRHGAVRRAAGAPRDRGRSGDRRDAEQGARGPRGRYRRPQGSPAVGTDARLLR
nr:hypothetical protein GCM10020092_086680 [Actinoplanes digitatis]